MRTLFSTQGSAREGSQTRVRALVVWGLAVWLAVFCPALASAQNFTVTDVVIGGSAGTSTNHTFSVSGSVGQPDAGARMSGGSFAVAGGFWQAITLLSTPGAPALQLSRNGTQATISWPPAVTGYILEFTASPDVPATWQPVSGVDHNSVTISAVAGKSFFRLKRAP